MYSGRKTHTDLVHSQSATSVLDDLVDDGRDYKPQDRVADVLESKLQTIAINEEISFARSRCETNLLRSTESARASTVPPASCVKTFLRREEDNSCGERGFLAGLPGLSQYTISNWLVVKRAGGTLRPWP
jgi:hypothetical protein